jgi:hypothetical protein
MLARLPRKDPMYAQIVMRERFLQTMEHLCAMNVLLVVSAVLVRRRVICVM